MVHMNAFKLCHQIRILIMTCFVTTNILIVIYYFFLPNTLQKNEQTLYQKNSNGFIPDVKNANDPYDLHDYVLNINSYRLNHLLKIIQNKEDEFESVMNALNLIQFNKLNKNDSSNNIIDAKSFNNLFKAEIEKYLDIEPNGVFAKDSLVHELNVLSNNYSFKSMHDLFSVNELKQSSNNQNTVIVTISDANSFEYLQATLYHLHLYLPKYKIIVYDLGLTDIMREKTKIKCRCELRKFNQNNIYSNLAKHVLDLSIGSWKPLIIQEVLIEYESVIYIDNTVRFHSNNIENLIEISKRVGMLTPYKKLDLNCYTNPKTYKWFNDNFNLYQNLNLIKTNVVVVYRNFLSSLILKSWITCALDLNCIAPEGSTPNGGLMASILGCKYCGCHRYEQSVITIINSFLYGHPKHSELFLPAYAMTKNESLLFTVNENFGMHYF